MTKRILTVLLVGILGLMTGWSLVNAYVIWMDGGFSPVPTTVYGYYDFTEATKTAIHNACNTWNNAGVGNLVYRSTSTHSNTTYPLQNSRNEITKGYRGDDKYLMQANMVAVSGTSLTEVDIDINVSKPFGTASGCYDTQSVMTHELGHLLGLWEENRAVCVMYPQIDKDVIRRNLYEDDIKGIKQLYQ